MSNKLIAGNSYICVMLSQTEENYLKSLFLLTSETPGKTEAGTNELAVHLNVKPASVNDMLKKLKVKKLISYEKYGKISLTAEGRRKAVAIVRKHRLWETFLYEKLGFTWDEVHEIAEQLEHIQSEKLIEKLDKFLHHPAFDPHGDAIPDANGTFKIVQRKTLAQALVGKSYKLIAVKDGSAAFLQYVVRIGLGINSRIKVLSRLEFDDTMEIEVSGKKSVVSKKFAENIFVAR